MTDLDVGQKVIVQIAYDIKHSSKHAIDYITHYDRLQPHIFSPAHPQETIDPTDGVAGVVDGSLPTDTEAVPAPSSTSPCASPVPGQPTASFNALPAGERVMSLWNGNFNTSPAISYVSEGCLTDAQDQTVVEIRFTTTATTAILAWGGHIATAFDWGAGNSAGGISGSPYHTRTITWNKNNIGNQDRSLSADAVECFCCTTTCNDNNACTSDSCDETNNACVFTPLALSTPCSADADLCTIDHCNGAGACVTFDNVDCQPAVPPCEGGETCNPATGLCVANSDAAFSTPCEADGDLCTNDHCNGSGSCVFLSNKTCDPAVPPCEGGEHCEPTTGACVANADAPVSTPCESDGDLCTVDHCNGAGVCVFFHDVVCQAADPPCEGGETCVAGVCQPNSDAVFSTPCEADGDLCTNDHCDGNGSCVFLSNVTCQAANPPCEGGEVCVAGNCVAQPDAQLSTPCEADGNLCTNDHCNGSGSCVFKDDVVCPADTQCATYDCNPSTGVCDATFAVLSTICERESPANLCTPDHCDGAGNCVPNGPPVSCSGTQCAGEVCDPATGMCVVPPGGYAPLSTPCEADGDLCTNDHCDGNGFCVFLSNVSCAPAVPPCEGGEYCEPTTGACLDNADAAFSTPCQADSDLCTIDHCNGSGACVTFDFVDCADPVPPCEAGQHCEPTTGACVDNIDAVFSTPCQADTDLCTIDHCDGNGACVTFDNVVCAGPVPPCEAGEQCNPSSGLCKPLTDAPLSTSCEAETPANLCTIDHCNGQGACIFLRDVDCMDAVPPCEGGEVCNPSTGLCDPQPDAQFSTPCQADSTLCTIDHCDGNGNCVFLSDVMCAGPVPPCEAGERCNPTTGFCDPLPDAQFSTPCQADTTLCTIDHCDGNGNCVFLSDVMCAGPIPPCEAGERCEPTTGLCVPLDDPVVSTPCDDDGDVCTTQHCDGHGDCVLLEYLCGACCDHEASDGVCVDLVFADQCIGNQLDFFLGEDCATIEAMALCEEHRGACCDAAQPGGVCIDNVLPADCMNVNPADQLTWYKDLSCGTVEAGGGCGEHVGACCDQRVSDPVERCHDDVPESQCPVATDPSQVHWFKFTRCADVGQECAEHTGACCDTSPQAGGPSPEGVCTDGVLPSNCSGLQQIWTKFTACADVTCLEVPGACCDLLKGVCTEGVYAGDCQGNQQAWTKGASCGEVQCIARTGACCDLDPFGSCTITTINACNCQKCVWHKLQTCEQIECVHNSIPTMSQWGLAVLTLLLLIGAKVYFGRRPAETV